MVATLGHALVAQFLLRLEALHGAGGSLIRTGKALHAEAERPRRTGFQTRRASLRLALLLVASQRLGIDAGLGPLHRLLRAAQEHSETEEAETHGGMLP